MKKIFIWILFWGLSLPAMAQITGDKTSESYRTSKTEVTLGETIELIFEVKIAKDWYIYSSDVDPDIGPIPTSFKFESNAGYELVGKVQPINAKKKYDKIWEADITYFDNKAEFRQKVKILKADAKITGSFEFQCCSNVTGQCLIPETVEFDFGKFKIISNGNKEDKGSTTTPKEDKKSGQDDTKANIQEKENKTVKSDNDKIDPNSSESKEDKGLIENSEAKTTQPENSGKNAVDFKNITPESANENTSSLIWFMSLAFLAGLSALLTPCVFPMIPMTVTFFSKNKKKEDLEGLSEEEIRAIERKHRREAIRKATFYGLSIILIYTLLGTTVSWINGPGFANWLSTHWVPNVFFFLMLVFFAFSFLGMYEIVLPNSWVNNADKQADKGGYYGIFFMAFTLALVSFSCTGPLVGLILVEAAGGMIVKPILGMFAFSLAIALPFSLFAAFPSWLNSLPKSGGWLNSVKVVLGFLELALAFKFLSIADQVYHWGILDRDIFLSIWIVIFGMIGFYLLGSIRLPHDSPVDKISVPRAALAIVSLAFVVYMVPGLFGAPLKQLSGYIPPQSSLDFDLVTDSEVEMIVAKKLKNSGLTLASQSDGKGIAQAVDFSEVKHANFLKLPHGLEGFFDYQQGVAYAKQVNKPIFIDFTGHGCVNCREMEARVWSDEEVLKRLQEEYVVIALYVDDRKTLPENEWYKSEYDQKVKKTIGQQNADLQIVKFNNNAQPFYTLLDHSGTLLVKPEAYNLNIQNFVDFLDIGVKNFQEKKNIATR